jgi:hypothetical protein
MDAERYSVTLRCAAAGIRLWYWAKTQCDLLGHISGDARQKSHVTLHVPALPGALAL